MADEKKGITVKIDADLHAEVKQYIEQHGMTMADFITLAVDNELHPKMQQKEEKNMGNMRTLAFQVPEELFQRIKGYLQRNNMTQRQFILGLIETELEREQAQHNGVTEEQDTAEAEETDMEKGIGDEPQYSDDTVSEDAEISDGEVDADGEEADEEETEDEEESEGFGMSMGGM